MKEVEISTASWHYRLIKFYGVSDRDLTDTCRYKGHLIGSIVLTIIAALTASFALLLGSLPFLYLIDVLRVAPRDVGMEVIATFIFALEMILLFVILKTRSDKKKNLLGIKKVEKNPGAIAIMWQDFKDKACSKVVLK